MLDGIHEREGKERNSNKGTASRFGDMVYFLLCAVMTVFRVDIWFLSHVYLFHLENDS